MGKRLRKIAELSFRTRVVLLGKKADVIPQGEQPFEKRAGILGSANQVQAVCQPKGAKKKNAFRSRQSINIVSLLAIAANETPFR